MTTPQCLDQTNTGKVNFTAADFARRERPLCYCARRPFVWDRLREPDPESRLHEGRKRGRGGNARPAAAAPPHSRFLAEARSRYHSAMLDDAGDVPVFAPPDTPNSRSCTG